MSASEGDRRAVSELVDRLFRAESGRMIAGLARVFGPAHLGLVEDVVQESLVRALRVWPYEGVPERPAAWLVSVARRAAVDALRRHALEEAKVAEVQRWADARVRDDDAVHATEIDDQLRLVFACCHPALSHDSRVALTLRTLCGLSTAEIARAFLSDEAAVAQRLVRTKRRIQEEGIPLEVPDESQLAPRLDAVLEVVYFLFNEGYAAHTGDALVRGELVDEALRLGRLLTSSPTTARPRTHALLALMSFLAARSPARVDEDGEVLTLSKQDRRRWDAGLLASAWRHFDAATEGDELTATHVECAIAACHAAAPDYASTDWVTILDRYDQLVSIAPTPVVQLNRAVALSKVHGPRAAWLELERLTQDSTLAGYHLLWATRGLVAWQLGRIEDASRAFAEALSRARTLPERRLLERRLAAVRAGEPPESY